MSHLKVKHFICFFLTIKPTRCTNFSNLFLKWNSTFFGQFLCPSSGVFHCTHSNIICHTGLLIAFKQDPPWFCSQAVSRPVWHIPLLCVQWKTPDDEQRNCPKRVHFHSKNKIQKLVQLVGFDMYMSYGWGSPGETWRPTVTRRDVRPSRESCASGSAHIAIR